MPNTIRGDTQRLEADKLRALLQSTGNHIVNTTVILPELPKRTLLKLLRSLTSLLAHEIAEYDLEHRKQREPAQPTLGDLRKLMQDSTGLEDTGK